MSRALTNFSVKQVSAEELNEILEKHFDNAFSNRFAAALNFDIDEQSKNKISDRKKNDQRYRLRLLAYEGSEVIGWHFGYAVDAETYYMQNSAIVPAYRKRGAYSKLLDHVLHILTEEGFQVVTSNHHPNNSAVLIPKLKKGFVISSMQFHERFKFLIELRLFLNKERRTAYGKQLGLELDE
ncbi:GNAT family N-acetyltransferase [Bdellovibrio reynosensis]|uniref:GNAT family N-acetyltransferase n=1 Tax=Bdellovibrio reynosensis TaxID=2835041 RepID=A0ABY4C4B8_9BACT|nr:GNAT family N-acetyltransferase [Bdellovibrio reynosensis]UOE99809.1 GNAT family N-acetyltransferase [Bdellovibrio reynosensis]